MRSVCSETACSCVGQASVRVSRTASTGKQCVNNRRARRPKAAHKRRLAAGDTSSATLIERDPEVIPDVDIAAHAGKDEASNVLTYPGLTTCTEVDKSWTIMSSAYNHVRSKRGKDERSMAMFIRKEVEHPEERLEAAGYRSPTWMVLRALQSYCPGDLAVLPCANLSSSNPGSPSIVACECLPEHWRGCIRNAA